MEGCLSLVHVIHDSKSYTVPCGRCAICLHQRKMSWIFRLHFEKKFSELPHHWFLTLTYDEKHVPRKKGIKTLYKRHPQLFFKKLRKAGGTIKYVLVGEYGSRTDRPHYHVLLFTDLQPDVISQAWRYGHVHFGSVTDKSVAYTVSYIMETRKGDNDVKQKEYAVFSKGIGLGYLTEAMYYWHVEPYESPRYEALFNGRFVSLPRYYRKKIFTKYQNALNAIKQFEAAQLRKITAAMKIKDPKAKVSEVLKRRHLRKAEKIVAKSKHNKTI